MKYYKQNGLHVVEVPARDFRVVLTDAPKKSFAGNYCNGGFFANFTEKGSPFTLPAGPLVCDVETINQWAKYYCAQRGNLSGGKLFYPCGSWDKQFYGRRVELLTVSNGAANIGNYIAPPPCDYAIMGVPVLTDGKAVSFTQAKTEGWDGSTLYATWHIFVGLKANKRTVYVVGMKTTTGNLLSSGEAARKLAALGIRDALKLDGGGSFHLSVGGKTVQSTPGNRRVNTILTFGGNPWPVPTRTLKQGKAGNDVKWLQWELSDRGVPCAVDGSFGPGTASALRAWQVSVGLEPDGSCGPETRGKLMK